MNYLVMTFEEPHTAGQVQAPHSLHPPSVGARRKVGYFVLSFTHLSTIHRSNSVEYYTFRNTQYSLIVADSSPTAALLNRVSVSTLALLAVKLPVFLP